MFGFDILKSISITVINDTNDSDTILNNGDDEMISL